MSHWTNDELAALGRTGELQISSRRSDGTLSPQVTIWAVREGDEIYIRSVNGPSATWYRAAVRRGIGHISSGGVDRDVQFEALQGDLDDAIDQAYRDKYGATSDPVQRINAPAARGTTLRLSPTESD
jgi:hypothetical protein